MQSHINSLTPDNIVAHLSLIFKHSGTQAYVQVLSHCTGARTPAVTHARRAGRGGSTPRKKSNRAMCCVMLAKSRAWRLLSTK